MLAAVESGVGEVTEEQHVPRILLIEDEPDLASLVTLHLVDIPATVDHCDRGDSGLERARSEHWDLIILDIRLPGMNGLEVCRTLRSDADYTPIMMLTSKSTELDRVLGLELGADDYVTKPFSSMELVARVKAVFRRVDQLKRIQQPADDQPLECGSLCISVRNHQVLREGQTIELTSREFDLLLHFARHPGQVFKRSELLDEVWGYGHAGYEHTVNSHINRLRSKIEHDPAEPEYILTVWGVGYKFSALAAEAVG